MSEKKRGHLQKRRVIRTTSSKNFYYKSNVSANWYNFVKNNGKRAINNTKRIGVKNIRNTSTSVAENNPVVTKVLALDCEMVSDLNDKNMIGRVSVVNFKLECLYDTFVKPALPVGDYRTRYSGIRKMDLLNGVDFEVAQREVRKLLQNKILVGHALENDFRVLHFSHDSILIRDTAKYEKFRELTGGNPPSLKYLAKMLLGENIQEGEHSSVEDARTAMKLYIKFRHEWESSLMKKN